MVDDNEQSAFIRAILAAPDDDAPKLIYADWLEEQGRIPDAESMRIGLRIASDNGIGLQMCWCPPGTFGSLYPMMHRRRKAPEKLDRGIWLGKFPVTQRQYEEITGENPSFFASTGEGRGYVEGLDTTRFPVEQVSLHDASNFCWELTSRVRKSARLSSRWLFCLPTISRWGYAYQAGTTTDTLRGARPDSHQANFNGSHPLNGGDIGPYLGRTSAVGTYPANPWGFHDLIGNVWEWCIGGRVPKELPMAHRLGGSWANEGGNFLERVPMGLAAQTRNNAQGFRVALFEQRKSR